MDTVRFSEVKTSKGKVTEKKTIHDKLGYIILANTLKSPKFVCHLYILIRIVSTSIYGLM